MDRTNLRQVLSELNDEYESLSNQDVVAVDVESIMSSGVNSGDLIMSALKFMNIILQLMSIVFQLVGIQDLK